ncbi:glycosyltransferase family 4 protein [Azospirillum sp. sgz302134]
MRKKPSQVSIVFATPGALDGGGGIGRMTGYIVDYFRTAGSATETIVLDTRGDGSALMSPVYMAGTLARLTGLLLRGKPSVIHINVSENASVWRKAAVQLVAGLFSCPTVVHLHGATFMQYFGKSLFSRAISRWLFGRCDIALVLGENWRSFLVQEVGVDPHKVRVLYNAVPDIGADQPARAAPPEGAIVSLLVLANLSERKGIGTLLRACALLKQQGFRFRLTIGGGGDVDGYRRMAAELGVAGECSFQGWIGREQAHGHIRSHDMLLLPSTHEGLPMVILEALSAGLPVVTTAVGSIPEVLTDDETARIVPVNDPEALARAVADLARHPALYARLSAEGRRLFLEKFVIDAYGRRLAEIYAELDRPDEVRRPQLGPLPDPAAAKPSLTRASRQ